MKVREVYYSSHFEQAYKKLPKSIQQKAILKESIFRNDCFDARLKTHKLKGKLDSFWSFSVDYNYRILFAFQEGGDVVLIDIGRHSVYQ